MVDIAATVPKLIIHLDINGTIMPADPITSKHVESMLNIHLSKQAFVREVDGSLMWWDGSPFHRGEGPPLLPQLRYTCHIREHYDEEIPNICCHVESAASLNLQDFRDAVFKGEGCTDFTNPCLPGNVYLPELERMLELLEWKHEVGEDLFTLPSGLGGKRMSLFVPAFLRLISWLQDREFVIVIRTFGSDIPRLIPALVAIAEGKHPDLPHCGCVLPPSLSGFLVQQDSNKREYKLEMTSLVDASRVEVAGNSAILDFFENLPSKSLILVNDDYDLWHSKQFDPCFGKPVFVDLDRINTHRHFLFDDNVNMNPKDSIASVWLRERGDIFSPLSLETPKGRATIGTVLLQANLYNSITQPDSFVEELIRAEKRYTSLARRLLE